MLAGRARAAHRLSSIVVRSMEYAEVTRQRRREGVRVHSHLCRRPCSLPHGKCKNIHHAMHARRSEFYHAFRKGPGVGGRVPYVAYGTWRRGQRCDVDSACAR